MNVEINNRWQKKNFQDFWAEIAPADHLVQLYESDNIFLNTLEGFVGSGFLAGDHVVIIATAMHLELLNERLAKQNLNISKLIKTGAYLPLDAHETLSRFMVNGWPDESLFIKTVNDVFKKVRKSSIRVRAFGEMVAILWAEGQCAATVHLEHLWNKFCETQALCLYCAYPKSGFTKNPAASMHEICCTHSKVIAGWDHPSTEILYSTSKAQ
jgi:hypothetical protein